MCTIASGGPPNVGPAVEILKWERYYRSFGMETLAIRGQPQPESAPHIATLDILSRRHPVNRRILEAAAAARTRQHFAHVDALVQEAAEPVHATLVRLVDRHGIEAIHVDALLSYPISLPFTAAIARLLSNRPIRVVSREHDYVWERLPARIPYFNYAAGRNLPPVDDQILHVALTSHALGGLAKRRPGGMGGGIAVPNMFSFDVQESLHRPAAFRESLELPSNALVFVQPTRCVPMKGIQHSVHFAAQVAAQVDRTPVLVVTGPVRGGFGLSPGDLENYKSSLIELSDQLGVALRFMDGGLSACPPCPHRADASARHFCVNDAYLAADLITFASTAEGFGNPVIESVVAQRPLFAARYPVMVNEFLPRGFDFLTMAAGDPFESPSVSMQTPGFDASLVTRAAELVMQPEDRQDLVHRNLAIAKTWYSDEWSTVRRYFRPVVEWLTTGAMSRSVSRRPS